MIYFELVESPKMRLELLRSDEIAVPRAAMAQALAGRQRLVGDEPVLTAIARYLLKDGAAVLIRTHLHPEAGAQQVLHEVEPTIQISARYGGVIDPVNGAGSLILCQGRFSCPRATAPDLSQPAEGPQMRASICPAIPTGEVQSDQIGACPITYCYANKF